MVTAYYFSILRLNSGNESAIKMDKKLDIWWNIFDIDNHVRVLSIVEFHPDLGSEI